MSTIKKKMKTKKVKTKCRYCGSGADMLTSVKDARKIPKKDKRFTCNECWTKYFELSDMRQFTLLKPEIRF